MVLGPAGKGAVQAGLEKGTSSGIEPMAGGTMVKVGERLRVSDLHPNTKKMLLDKKMLATMVQRRTWPGKRQAPKLRYKPPPLLNLERLGLRKFRRKIKKKLSPGLNQAKLLREELQVGKRIEEILDADTVG